MKFIRILAIIVAVVFLFSFFKSESHPTLSKKTQFYPNQASSLSVVVNKGRQLPQTYVPRLINPSIPLRLESSSDEMKLRPEAANSLERMAAAAKNDGVRLMLASGYRSFASQNYLYNLYVQNDGQANADAYSARAGYSEHQTGLAADLEPDDKTCEVQTCFADTEAGKWLSNNAYKFGFILRYPKDKTQLTGYDYEPWHYRYVGTDLSFKLHTSSQTLEQYFKLPTYQSYSSKPYKLS